MNINETKQGNIFGGRVSIAHPDLLCIREGDDHFFGGDQEWYKELIRRRAGCGPTTSSNLLWYLAATRPERCAPLFAGNGCDKAQMLELMNCVWGYVTPGMRGVNRSSMLTDGVIRYGAEREVALNVRVLEVPYGSPDRPNKGQLLDFLTAAFADDLPVAFLNLSNGAVRNLDRWHWVTLVSVNGDLVAEMYDQSCRSYIDLALWLATAEGDGAFVAVEPQK